MDPEDLAEEYGITIDEAEDLLEAIIDSGEEWEAWGEWHDEQETDALWDVPLDEQGDPDDEFMQELAERFEIDISDLYDMYYGYEPD